ncbi:alginate O-acetyltransferase AlgF [Spirochaeta isovalerica]|uniref:Alginate biosynthesis protein AlgF n=1 Tax=Spirochaeta isovalerica TaxID=150 RepID=A0A841RIM5_9SPIO|nr:alginate O-acetyltransferase AlgF [Spirochaeta isovalerica]MBB6482378.1 hypothetical protein [Spirochaeta isovalerica]
MMKKVSLMLLLSWIVSISLAAQSLYGSGISPESALVRVIFAEPRTNMEIHIGSETFSTAESRESALYHQIGPGMYFIEAGDDFLEIIPMSGKYYTLIFTAAGSFAFEDIEHEAPAKNQIYFYNCLEETASLYVSETGDDLFSDINPGQSVQRAVNPLEIDFALKSGSGKILELGPLPMTRGGSTSVIVYGNNASPRSMVITAGIKEP